MIDKDSSQESEGARYALSAWDTNGVARITATGQNEEAALSAALAGILALGRGGDAAPPAAPESAAGSAAAIRGQGAGLAEVFTELAGDLLAQLDENGPGLSSVRLDGLLQTDDGYTAWGYVLGEPEPDPPAVGFVLVGTPSVERDKGEVTIRCQARREPHAANPHV